ncbi:methionine import ATP-binding protein MetN [Salmonella enterica subsp. enterica serovar Choleraesuis]|nr:methionine import ATP-binding protein MetN [Salmonella enterica subsp. enterica serovar Choleraesuis]
MIEIQNITKNYRLADGSALPVLNGLSLRVQRGEIAAVVGPSGAGKSTLAKCISLHERPDSGEILVNGQDLSRLRGSELRAARRAIGTVFQSSALLQRKTAWQNVALPLEYLGVVPHQIKERVETLLDDVGLSHKAQRYPAQLSGGERQRIGIARALALHPTVLLADEATSGLDPATTESTLELLKRLRDEYQLAIVLITHEMDAVRRAADTVAEIDGGKIVSATPLAQLLAQPESALAQRLLPTPQAESYQGLALRVAYRDAVPVDWISRLTRQWQLHIDLLGGHIETVNGRPAGRLTIGVRFEGRSLGLPQLVAAFNALGLAVETLNTAPAWQEAV